jgi:hypothetical protein
MTRCTYLFDLPENVSRDVYCRKCHFGTPYALQNVMTRMLNFKISTFAEITLSVINGLQVYLNLLTLQT